MQECELCNSAANMYCESDEASLCWSCDSKIHSANFLVAKHSRCLLCHICQSPTQWKASGEKLGRTLSVCDLCKPRLQVQVIPLTSSSSSSSSAAAAAAASVKLDFPVKRPYLDLNASCDTDQTEADELCCSASSSLSSSSSSSSRRCPRPLKISRTTEDTVQPAVNKSETDLLLNSLNKFHRQILYGSTSISRLNNLAVRG